MFSMIRGLFFLLLCVAVIGWYRGWFTLSNPSRDPEHNKLNINVSVDTGRVQADVKEFEAKIGNKVAKQLQNDVFANNGAPGAPPANIPAAPPQGGAWNGQPQQPGSWNNPPQGNPWNNAPPPANGWNNPPPQYNPPPQNSGWNNQPQPGAWNGTPPAGAYNNAGR